MKIIIAQSFSTDFITRAAGERLRQMILEAFSRGETIEIDFTGVVLGSPSFLDEGLAKLAIEGWTAAQFDERVHIRGINRFDSGVLRQAREYRGLV